MGSLERFAGRRRALVPALAALLAASGVALAPFALLLSPALAAAPAARGVNPLRAALAVGAVLMSLSGTVVDVDAPGASIKIRIF